MSTKDPYATAIEQLKKENGLDIETAPGAIPKATYEYAAQRSPDEYAKALKAQSEVGLPAPIAEQDGPNTAFQLRMRELNKNVQVASPEVQAFVTSHPDTLTVTQDDIGVLDKVSRTLKDFWHSLQYDESGGHKAANDAIITPQQLREPVYSFAAGAQGLQTGARGSIAGLAGQLAESIRQRFGGAGPVTRFLDGLEAGQENEAGKSNEKAQALVGDRENMGFVERGINSGIESLPGNLVSIGATLLAPETVAPALGAAIGGFLSAGQERTDLVESGVSKERANNAALQNFMSETGTEMLPLQAIVDYSGGQKGILKTLEKYGLSEHMGEQVATLLQDFSHEAATNPDQTLKEYIDNHDFASAAGQTFLATMVSTVIVGGGLGALNTAEMNKQKAEQTKNQQNVLTKLDGLMSESKTRGRAPEVVRAFVESQMKGVSLHIDAHSLADILNSSGVKMEEVREKVPSIDAQIDDALTLGGDVVVPVSEWAAGMAGEKYNQEVLPHTRVGQSELSQDDIDEFGEKQAIDDAKKELETSTEINDRFQQIRTIEDNIAQQLIAAKPDIYTAENALTSAALAGAWYDTLAQNLKVTPEEAFAKFPVQIQAGEGGDFNQSVFHGSPHDFDQFSLQKIGTGEGNQTFGYGLYFASNKAVAEYYKATLSTKVNMEGGAGADGAVYEVDIPDDTHFMEYESTINAQSPMVRDAIIKAVNESSMNEGAKRLILNGTATASYAYKKLAETAGDEANRTLKAMGRPEQGMRRSDRFASEKLASLGVAGIRYLDQVSRRSGKGSQNYVVFDDRLARIVNKFKQDMRGSITFEPSAAVIKLSAAADLTTFLHESAHMFLQTYTQLAEDPSAPSFFREQIQILNDWLGEGTTTQKHEKFADAFEQYLFQGKAPSEGLKSVFRMYADWFKRVYLALRNMGKSFSPEVTHVVNAMLAAEKQVNIKEAQLRAEPMFDKRDKANLSDEQWADYQATDNERTQKAIETLQTRSLRDMKWMRNARSKELTRLQKLSAARREEAQAVATQEVRNQPIRQIENFLLTGDVSQEDGSTKNFEIHKLDLKELEAMYAPLEEDDAPVPDWRELKSGKTKLVGQNGLHPDDVAQMAGSNFTSGDQLVRKLAELRPINEEIEALTDLIMLENYGDIYNKETLERAVDIAVHNDARIKMAAIELKALGSSISIGKLTKIAKQFAEDAVGRKQVGFLRVKDFELAESRASRKAMAALQKGDLVEATMHKKNQILNGIAAKYAAQALDEVRDQIRYNQKFRKDSLKARIGRDTVEQIAGLLEQFGFREPTGAIRPTLGDWIVEQNAIGYDPGVPAWILGGTQTAYTALTVDQFREVSDAIRAVEETGRNRQTALVKGQAIAFEVAEANLVDSIHQNAAKTVKQGVVQEKGGVVWLKKLKSTLTLFDFAAREIDGWKDVGAMYNLLVTMKNKASDYKTKRSREAYDALNKLQKLLGNTKDTASFIPEINMSLTRNQRIKFALYSGTKESAQRQLDGGIYSGPAKLTPDQARAIIDSLTKKEMEYVQGMWDFFGTFWPEIIAKEKRLKGYAPKPAVVIPVESRHGNFTGGYFPIDYDRRGEGMHNDPDSAQEAYDKTRMGKYTGIVTKNGALNERVATIKDRPLDLDLSTTTRHVEELIHDLAFHEWAIQSHKVLYSDKVKAAILQHYPISMLDNLRKERENIIKGNIGAVGAGDQVIRSLRKWSAVGALAFNFNAGLMQPIGLLQAIPRIGATGLAVGVMRALQNTSRLELPSTYAIEHSEFMKNNYKNSTQELAAWKKELEASGRVKRVVDKTTGFVLNDLGFMWLRGMNNATNNIVWLGAESKARYQLQLESEEEIIQYADNQVRDTQGSGLKIDKSLFEQSLGGEILTMYYTFFSRTYNLSREIAGKTKSVKDIPRTAYHYGMMIGMASILATIVHGLRSKDPDKDLQPIEFVKDAIAFILNTVPVGREFGGLIQGYPYRGPAITSAIKQLYDMIPAAEKIIEGGL